MRWIALCALLSTAFELGVPWGFTDTQRSVNGASRRGPFPGDEPHFFSNLWGLPRRTGGGASSPGDQQNSPPGFSFADATPRAPGSGRPGRSSIVSQQGSHIRIQALLFAAAGVARAAVRNVKSAVEIGQWRRPAGRPLDFPCARELVALMVCLSLAGPPAASLASPGGSPVAREVAELLDKYYLDRNFNGVDIKAEIARLSALELSDEEALKESTNLVSKVGDRYSRIVRPSGAAKLNKYDVTGVGINLVIKDSGDVTVGAVPPMDSDAGRLGVAFGDVVTSINGKAAAGMTSFDALEAIQTKADVVTLALRSAATGEEREVNLRKAFTARNAVSYHIVETQGAKVGYIRLDEFNDQCKMRVREAVSELESEGASRLVLDIRKNRGGVLDGAVGIAGLFSDRPLVLYVTDAFGKLQPIKSREASQDVGVPIQVWVDNSTASAGEVLAAALRDNCRATVVGTKTYGKGVIQGVFGLSDGGALVETVASYTTPAGQEINLKGVEPTNERIFISDVLGSKLVDADVQALAGEDDFRPARSCVVPTEQSAQGEENSAPTVSKDQGVDVASPATDAPTTKSA